MKLKNLIYTILLSVLFTGVSHGVENETLSGFLKRLKSRMIDAYDLDYGSVLIELNVGTDAIDFYSANQCILRPQTPEFVLNFFQNSLMLAVEALENSGFDIKNQRSLGQNDVEFAVAALKEILPTSSLKACLVEGEHYGYYQFLFFTLDSPEELGVIFVGQPD